MYSDKVQLNKILIIILILICVHGVVAEAPDYVKKYFYPNCKWQIAFDLLLG